jgi:hypothetical protein
MIYDFVDELDDQELLGYNEPFDSRGFMIESINRQVHGYSMKNKATVEHAERMQPYLNYRPLNITRHTLESTAQLPSQLVHILM